MITLGPVPDVQRLDGRQIEVIFRDLGAPFDDLAMRRQLVARLNTIPDVSFIDERLETWASMPLLALSDDDELSDFFTTWEWYIDLVMSAAADLRGRPLGSPLVWREPVGDRPYSEVYALGS